MRIGVLADTHGLLRPEVIDALDGSELILHAGDVGEAAILDRLASMAPVVAVRGNVDVDQRLLRLPQVASGIAQGVGYRVTHRREDVEEPWLRASRLVVFGHSHRPELAWRGDCLLLNPGACGPRRFRLPLTVARLRVEGERLLPEILSVE